MLHVSLARTIGLHREGTACRYSEGSGTRIFVRLEALPRDPATSRDLAEHRLLLFSWSPGVLIPICAV